MMKNKLNLIILTAIISGVSIFVNSFGLSFNNPYIFTFIKNFVVAVFLFSLILLFKEYSQLKKISKKNWLKLSLIGLIGGSVPFLMFFKGLTLTSSAKGAFIHKTMFLYVAIFAYFFLKEKLSWKSALAGITLIIGNLLFLKLTWSPFNYGDLLILGATILWAAENTLSKHILKNISPSVVGFSRMFFGSIFIMIFLVATGNFSDLYVLTGQQFMWAIIPSIFLALYVLTWYNGIKHVNLTTATAILSLGSPITTLLNVFYKGVALSLVQTTGMIFIVVSVIVFVVFSKDMNLPDTTRFVN